MSAPVVAITGAAGAIGRATAGAFSAAGWAARLLDRAPAPCPEGAVATTLDLTVPEAVAAAFAGIGPLDALVCVAGINHRSTIAEMRVADWDRMMETNLGHMFLCAKHAMPRLREGGAIVLMASISGHVASADYPAYVTTKAGVESFAAALSQEAGRRGVRVNAVAPGWVDGGFTDEAKAGMDDPATLETAAAKAHLLGRMARPEEVASAVLWLASPAASFVTGQTLFVDGGLMRVH